MTLTDCIPPEGAVLVCVRTQSIISNHITRLTGQQYKHAASRGRAGEGELSEWCDGSQGGAANTNPGSGNHNERGFLHLMMMTNGQKCGIICFYTVEIKIFVVFEKKVCFF